MSSQKLAKKGSVARDKEGKLLLVNEDNEAYVVDEPVIAIWNVCDGKTSGELVDEIASSTGREAKELEEPVESILSSLKDAKLVT